MVSIWSVVGMLCDCMLKGCQSVKRIFLICFPHIRNASVNPLRASCAASPRRRGPPANQTGAPPRPVGEVWGGRAPRVAPPSGGRFGPPPPPRAQNSARTASTPRGRGRCMTRAGGPAFGCGRALVVGAAGGKWRQAHIDPQRARTAAYCLPSSSGHRARALPPCPPSSRSHPLLA